MKPAAVELIQEFVKNIGLDKTEAMVDVSEECRDFSTGPGMRYIFHLRLPISLNISSTSHPALKVFQKVQDLILESPLIKETIVRMSSRINELEQEVKSLQKYKTHYDMAYDLSQGKEQIVLEEKKT